MKKPTTKKLALHGERVRVLTVDQLDAVVGGVGLDKSNPLTSGKPSCAAH